MRASVVVVHHRIDRATRIRRWLLRIGTVVLGATSGLMLASVAHAFWGGGGSGVGTAATSTLSPPTNVVATSSVGTDLVSLSWGAATPSSGGSVQGYYVARSPSEGGSTTPACGTSETTLTTALHCTDTGVPDGSYRYVVVAVLGGWTEPSAASAPVTVRLNADVPSVTATTTPAPNANGYNSTSPVTVQLSATDSDGIASLTYQVNGGAPVTVNASSTSLALSGNGTFTVTYSAADNLGKTSPTGTRTVRIDTVAPAAPAAPTLTAASDTGISSSDRITNDRTPTFSGVAEPGATVYLFSDGAQVGSAVASIDGSYAVTSGSLLNEGARAITVRAMDLAGNLGSLSPSTSVTIDVTAPAAQPDRPKLSATSDTGRSSTDFVTSDSTPTFFDNGPGGTVGGVYLYAGGVLVGSSTAAPEYTVTSSQLADGVHSMTVRSSDPAGNLSVASLARSVTIDTTAPAAPSAPALSAGSDTGTSGTDRVTNDSTPTVAGSNESSAIVLLYAGATQVGSQTTSSNTYSITATSLSDGQHNLTATATDTAGNVGPASAVTTITVDTAAPAAPSAPVLSAASDSGSSSSDRVTNDSTPTFTGTATAGTNVTLYVSATATGSSTIATGGSWTATTGTLADGTHSITARTDPDLAGNVGISSATTVTIDTGVPSMPAAPPVVAASDSGRSTTDGVTNDTTPTFFDNVATGVVGVWLYDAGVQVGSATASSSYMVTASTLSEGSHSMTVRVFDLAGNISVHSASRAVTVDTVAPSAPSAPTLDAASDTGSSSTDRVTNDTTPTVTGSNESAAVVTLFAGGSAVGTQTTSSTSHSVTASTLAEGSHVLTTTATDVAGNVGPASAGTTITVDTTAPAAPSAPVLAAASDSGISSSDRITNNTTLTFTGTAPAGSSVTLHDGAGATGSSVTATGGSYTATTGALTNGDRTITARSAPDLAGNVGISTATVVTVDTVAPTVAISVNSAAAVRFNVTFSETVHGFTSSDVTLSGTANATAVTVTGSGASYQVQASGMNRTGTVVVNLGAALVTDAAGNNNAASTSNTNVINYTDGVAPTVAVTKFVAVGGQTALVEGTVGTSPGDPSTVTVVLCTSVSGNCPAGDTKATLTANVDPATGTWSVTSGALGATPTLYARAFATDLSGNTGVSGPAGPIAIPAAGPTLRDGAAPATGLRPDKATDRGPSAHRATRKVRLEAERRRYRHIHWRRG